MRNVYLCGLSSTENGNTRICTVQNWENAEYHHALLPRRAFATTPTLALIRSRESRALLGTPF